MTRDVSRDGVYVITDRPVKADEIVLLTLLIPGAEDWSIDMYPARAQVVRLEPGGFAGKFVDPPADLVAAIDALVRARAARR